MCNPGFGNEAWGPFEANQREPSKVVSTIPSRSLCFSEHKVWTLTNRLVGEFLPQIPWFLINRGCSTSFYLRFHDPLTGAKFSFGHSGAG